MDTSFLGGVLNRPAAEASPAKAGASRGRTATCSYGPTPPAAGCSPGIPWPSWCAATPGRRASAGRWTPRASPRRSAATTSNTATWPSTAWRAASRSLCSTARRGRVLLYRNLVGAGFTYYHAGLDGLLFGGNLADLVERRQAPPRPNREALPRSSSTASCRAARRCSTASTACCRASKCLGRARPDAHAAAHLRRLAGDRRRPAIAVDALEATMAADPAPTAPACGRPRPICSPAASTALTCRPSGTASLRRRASAAQLLGQRRSSAHLADTDYAMTAAQALGTRHTLVPADGPYADYLLETLAATGEPPNHVQTAYFLAPGAGDGGRGIDGRPVRRGRRQPVRRGPGQRRSTRPTSLRRRVPWRSRRGGRLSGAAAGAVGPAPAGWPIA